MSILKSSIMISPALALLMAVSMVTGCATNQGGKAAEAELADSTVRTPPGDPTKFWDEFGWSDMSKAEQAFWGVLG